MEDEDDASSRSHSPSSSSSLPPLPISIARPSSTTPFNAQPANPVTVASSFPQQILTLALPIQPPLGSAAAAYGGREDCWSEGATAALVDAWGERYLDLNRGNLKQKQWQEVADVVSSRDDYSKTPKTDAQCKNRIDTLKKKYKVEKVKMGSSSWPFFHRLDFLFGPSLKPSPSATTIPKKQRTNLSVKRKASSPPVSPSSMSDRFPPETNGRRRDPPAKRELAQAIRRFGEVYQRVESTKLQQSMEMERQRMEFSIELERQRLHFFTKTQLELSQLKRHRTSSGSGGGGNIQNRRRHGHQLQENRDNGDNDNFGSGYV